MQSDLGAFKKNMQAQEGIDAEYYLNLKQRFSHAPDSVKEAYSKYVPKDLIIDGQYEGVAYYDISTGNLHMHYGYDSRNPRGVGATWFHEMGHVIDRFAGWPSHSEDFHNALWDDYLENVFRKYYNKSNKDAYLEISRRLKNMREHSAVSDLFDGLSNKKIRGVAEHDKNYWTGFALQEEAFAHMYECLSDRIRYKQMKEYFPTALKYFEDMLKRI